ncbi:AAA family ATPase [Lentzea alba]|uniref:ATP-binding protein n=1 Tax=Lentzea alba TaxID=2714351 RepID=UPI0039BF1D3C
MTIPGDEYDHDIAAGAILARVRHMSESRQIAYLDYANGTSGSISSKAPLDFDVGAVLQIWADQDFYQQVPEAAWPSLVWVGVVRLRRDDVTIVDSGGHLKLVPTRPDVEYEEGNTVEVKELFGVTRVLSEEPVRFIDLPAVNDSAIEKFITKPKEQPETFEDFGGMEEIVARARELVETPLKYHAELASIGARAIKGVLFTGLPGTGKTMLARIIANEADAQFYEISGPEIFSKWYGQSEEVLRQVFDHAARADRSIIFFDEIDSVAGQRTESAHEASKRVVAQLLTLMDGFTTDSNVVVIAATNRPEDIDVALLRPGRFDWEINFSLPNEQDREAVLRVATRKLKVVDPLPHKEIARITKGWSCAELSAIWSEAALLAVTDRRQAISTEDYYAGFERVAAHRQRRVHRQYADRENNERN